MKLLFSALACLLSMSAYCQNEYSIEFISGDQPDYIEIPGSNLNLQNNMTLSCWFKTPQLTNQKLFSNSYNCDNNNYFMMIDNGSGCGCHLKFNVNCNSSSSCTDINGGGEASSSILVNDNEWHYAVGTWDGYTIKLYLDGILLDEVNGVNGIIPYHPNATTTFANNACNSEPLFGKMDDVSIWNISLTQEDIISYMNCPPTGNEEGLVGYWKFEEGSGNIVYDNSGNNNNGNIIDTEWSTDTPDQNCNNNNGCTDISACNYNPTATIDDGSCEYITPVDLGEDIETCEESVTLDAGAGYDNYSWSTGDTSQTIYASNSGSYSVTVGDGTCTATDSVYVDVLDATIIQNDTAICFGDSVTLGISSDVLLGQGLNQYALDFSQGQYVRIPMSSSLSNFTDYTMEFWYYETGGHGSDEMIVGTEFFSGNRYGIYSFVDGYWPYIRDNSTFLGISYNGTNPNAGISYNMNEWNHIAITYDGSMFRFFINGQISYSESGNVSGFGPLTEDLVINRHTWSGSSSRLSGQLDELRISDIARYTSSFSPPQYEFQNDVNTKGLWRFNEGNGGQVLDASGNNNHGNINGTSWSTNLPFASYTYGVPEIYDSYSWSTGDTSSTITVSPSQTTTYSVTVDNGTTVCTDSVTVTVNAASVDLGADTLGLCAGDSVLLDAGAGYDNYSWSTGDTSQTIYATNSGSYSVTLADGTCTATDSVYVDVLDATIIQNDTAICFGDSVTLGISSDVLLGQGLNQYALDFSQGQYVRIPMSSSLSNFTDYTMEFWYYETGGHGSDEMIVGTEFFSGNRYGIYSFVDGYWPYIRDNSTFLGISYNGTNPNAGISYNMNEWNHIAITYDGSMFRFFINGQISYSESGNVSGFGPLTEDLVINRHTWSGSSSRLSGQLDELRISDIARYTSSFSPPQYEFQNDVNTKGLWRFNEGNGGQVLDASGNNNHGNINGTSWSTNLPFASYTYGVPEIYDSYSWSTGDTSSTITVSPSQTTTYSVTVDNGTTVCTDSVTVTVNAATVDLGPDTLGLCAGDSILLDAGAGYDNYSWNTGDTSQTIYASNSGSYSVTVGDGVGVDNDYSMSFDGVDDYIDLQNPNDFDFSNSPLSIMCWVYINNNSYLDGILSKNTSSNLGWWLSSISDDQSWQYPNTFQFGGSPSSGNYFGVSSPIILNNWVFLAATHINGEQKLYANGLLIDQSSHQYDLYNSATNLLIGKKIGDTYFDGLLDNISIWATVLSQSEIQNYMNCPPTR